MEAGLCVDECHVGSRALHLPPAGGNVVGDAGGCTGCRVCEMVCPARSRAIVVEKIRG